jgi:hypothetical protein
MRAGEADPWPPAWPLPRPALLTRKTKSPTSGAGSTKNARNVGKLQTAWPRHRNGSPPLTDQRAVSPHQQSVGGGNGGAKVVPVSAVRDDGGRFAACDLLVHFGLAQ